MPSMILGGLCIAVVSASCYGAANYLRYQTMATDEHLALERTERANAELQQAIGRTQNQIDEIKEGRTALLHGLERDVAAYDELVVTYDKDIASHKQILAWLQSHIPKPGWSYSGMFHGATTAVATAIATLMTQQAHFPEKVTHAFLQRIRIESGFNPQAVSPGGTYHCLVQWDHTRYAQLLQFTGHRPTWGTPCPSVENQVAFIRHEMERRLYSWVLPRAMRGDAYHEVTAGYFGGVE